MKAQYTITISQKEISELILQCITEILGQRGIKLDRIDITEIDGEFPKEIKISASEEGTIKGFGTIK